MRIKVSVIAALGGLAMSTTGTTALAGHCGPNAGYCGTSVEVSHNQAAVFDPMTVNIHQPMGHLRAVEYKRAPNVNITRVHGMASTASLSDAPSGFTGGCHPTSTTYCRAEKGTPVNVTVAAPAPVMAAPVSMGPRFGSGPNPADLQPRQYGDNTFTPGIAHIPTSIVDRSPENAQAVLNSGRTRPQSTVLGGVAPNPAMMRSQPNYSVTLPGSHNMANRVMMAPAMTMGSMHFNPPGLSGPLPMAPPPAMLGGPTQAPVQVGPGLHTSPIGADGTYWEQTSGPRFFGDTLATKVICKRALPKKVVNPVIGVPVAVPTPVLTECTVPQGQVMHDSSRYAGPTTGRWTY